MGSFNGHLTFRAQNEKMFVSSLNSILWWLNLGHHSQQIFIFTKLKLKELSQINPATALSHCAWDILWRSFPCMKISRGPLKPAWANFLINDVTVKWSKHSDDRPYLTWGNHKKGFNQSNVCMQQHGARHHSSNQPQGWISMSHLLWVRKWWASERVPKNGPSASDWSLYVLFHYLARWLICNPHLCLDFQWCRVVTGSVDCWHHYTMSTTWLCQRQIKKWLW